MIRAHISDAGFDLVSAEAISIPPGQYATVGTGVTGDIPFGHVGLVCPRSGLAARHGVTVLNSPGVVDAGYTGEIKVVLINHGSSPFEVSEGERVAQLVVTPLSYYVPNPAGQARGSNGFGSTGV